MKKQFLIAVGVAFLLAGIASRLNAQTVVTGHISAEVIDAVAASEEPAADSGGRSTGAGISNSVIFVMAGTVHGSDIQTANAFNAATFVVSGAKNGDFSVTLPDSPITLTPVTGSKTMKIYGWTATVVPDSNCSPASGGTGKVIISVSLRSDLSNDNLRGLYAGSYPVTFAYN